jgi:ribonuclease HI
MTSLVIHTDGGARGNPGLAGVGVYMEVENQVWQHGRVIGEATNNTAEYQAVLDSLSLIKQLQDRGELEQNLEIEYYLDSELVVRQINGQYKVKDANLRLLHQRICATLSLFKVEGRMTKYQFGHVRREANQEADALYNAALDGDQSLNRLVNK